MQLPFVKTTSAGFSVLFSFELTRLDNTVYLSTFILAPKYHSTKIAHGEKPNGRVDPGQYSDYRFEVGNDPTITLDVSVDASTGDPDLYIARVDALEPGQRPTRTLYEWASAGSGEVWGACFRHTVCFQRLPFAAGPYRDKAQ